MGAFVLRAFYFAFFALCRRCTWRTFPLYLAWRGLSAVEIAWVLALPPLVRIFAPGRAGAGSPTAPARSARIVAFSCAVTALGFALLPFTGSIIAVADRADERCSRRGALPLVEAITLGALAGQPGRYGPIRLWGSVGFIAAVLARRRVARLRSRSRRCRRRSSCSRSPRSRSRLSLPAAARAARAKPCRCASTARVARAARRRLLHARRRTARCTPFSRCTSSARATAARPSACSGRSACWPRSWCSSTCRSFSGALRFPRSWSRASPARWCAFSPSAGSPTRLWMVLLAQLLHAATFGAFHAAAVAAVHRVFPGAAHSAAARRCSPSVTYGAGGRGRARSLAGWAWEAGGPGLAFSSSALAGTGGTPSCSWLETCRAVSCQHDSLADVERLDDDCARR